MAPRTLAREIIARSGILSKFRMVDREFRADAVHCVFRGGKERRRRTEREREIPRESLTRSCETRIFAGAASAARKVVGHKIAGGIRKYANGPSGGVPVGRVVAKL